MRAIIRLVALASLGIAALAPVAASAQTLDRVLGLLSGATAYGYDSCSYVSGGVQSASCQANRAVNVVNTLRQSERYADQRRRETFERRAQQLTALQRACRAGDQASCARSGGADDKSMEIARALMDACQAGDRASCGRAEASLSGGRAYAERPAYAQRAHAPRGYEQRAHAPGCGGVDPRTGYRRAC